MTTGRYVSVARHRAVSDKLDHHLIIQMYNDGWTIRAIAYELDAVYTTIRDVLIRHGVTLRPPSVPARVNVSYSDYIKARKALAAGRPTPPKLGTTPRQIEELRRQIGWDPSWIDWARDPAWDMEEATT